LAFSDYSGALGCDHQGYDGNRSAEIPAPAAPPILNPELEVLFLGGPLVEVGENGEKEEVVEAVFSWK